MRTEFGKVAVLMGGNSAEREISRLSGQAVLAALLRQNIDVMGIDTAHNVVAQLTETPIDRAFIALHGRGGEDGTIQGMLELLRIPYTGSRVLGSALALDKYRTKQLWQSMGLPTPIAELIHSNSQLPEIVAKLGLPLMVKPVLEGSSVGMCIVSHIDELAKAYETASHFDCVVMAERYINGPEFTAAILQDTVLPLIRLTTPREFYDFTAKYSDTQTTYLCPCGLPPSPEKALQDLAFSAFQSVGGEGWGRVDFLCDDAGKPWLIEVNTVPGLTDHSLVPMAAKAANISFDELILRILATV